MKHCQHNLNFTFARDGIFPEDFSCFFLEIYNFLVLKYSDTCLI